MNLIASKERLGRKKKAQEKAWVVLHPAYTKGSRLKIGNQRNSPHQILSGPRDEFLLNAPKSGIVNEGRRKELCCIAYNIVFDVRVLVAPSEASASLTSDTLQL